MHTQVCMFRVCVHRYVCVCVWVCVCTAAESSAYNIVCEVCTIGSVRGQQGTCTLRPRTEPPDPKGLGFCGGGTGAKAGAEHDGVINAAERMD